MSKQLLSTGYLSQMLQVSPTAIRAAMAALSMTPAIEINGVAHFDDEQVEALRRHISESQSLVETRAHRRRGR